MDEQDYSKRYGIAIAALARTAVEQRGRSPQSARVVEFLHQLAEDNPILAEALERAEGVTDDSR